MSTISIGSTNVLSAFKGTTAIKSVYRGAVKLLDFFSPLSLFANGEQGVWYEPSATTAFLSTTDLTPCGYGESCGLLLDKSQGAGYSGGSFTGLGSEANGNPGAPFTTVTPYRNIYSSGTSPALSGDVLVAANSETWAAIGTDLSVTPGKTYLIEADASISISNGKFRVNDGITFATSLLVNADSNPGVRQVYSAVVTPTVSTIHAGIFAYNSAINPAVTLYSLSVKELPGNHATQDTEPYRPILARVPQGGRRNELSETDTLATQSVTVTAAERTLSFTGTGTVTLTGASTAGPLVGTGAGDRVSLTFTPSAGSLTLTVLGTVTDAQLELGASATTYQSVADSLGYDITEAGVTSLEYLAFDGSDDVMQSTNTNWAATQTAWASAGASSSNGAAATCVIFGVSNGFYSSGAGGEIAALHVISSGGNRWSLSDVGGASDSLINASPDITIPNVLTGYSDGSNAYLRRDGSQVATATTNITSAILDLNKEIDIGAWNSPEFGGSGFILHSPLNLFGLIIRLDPPSAQELSDTESYLASKSGVTL